MSLATELRPRRIIARSRLAFPARVRQRVARQSSKAIRAVSLSIFSSLASQVLFQHTVPTFDDVDRDSKESLLSLVLQYVALYYAL